nr:pollen-specific leucine-rich repeat extensin-like protein 2 [Parasteatoda tepidariorum]
MSPNSSGAVNCRRDISIRNPKSLSVKYQPTDISMKRAGPSGAGSTIPLATERSEFEDFMNAYRPNLETARREFEPQPKPAEESKVDFGRSIKKLMKRPTNSPSTQKSIRKEGFTRTPTLAIPNHPERERSVTSDGKPMSEKKTKRPLSATIETFAPPASAPGPTTLQPPNAILPKTEITPPPSPLPPPPPKAPKPPVKSPKNGLEDLPKALPESAPVLPASVPPPLVPVSIPAHVS